MSTIQRPATLVLLLVAALLMLTACAPPESAEAPDAVEEATVEASELTPAEATPVAGDFETDTHKFEEVADGVYFVTYTVPMFNSNSMVVINESDVLVVDSHITPTTARQLIESIRKVTDKPITTVVNTHFHFDHAHGNQVFGPIQIVGHEHTRMRMAGTPHEEPTFAGYMAGQRNGLERLEAALADAEVEDEEGRAEIEARIASLRGQIAANDEVVPTPPNTTFNERITLIRGDREIQVIFCGRAHTGGDVVIYLPADKIAFTGDMMLGGPSFLGDGHVDEWPETLENLKALDIELILPGHGPGITDLQLIDHVQAFYRDLWNQVVASRAEGKNIGETVAAVDLSAHAENFGRPVGTDAQAVGRMFQLLDERGE